jgi:Xaa-Pro aminopeptidase
VSGDVGQEDGGARQADWQVWLDPDARRPLPAVDRHAHATAVVDAVAALGEGDRTGALLVTGTANLRWLTGFTGSNGAALVLPDTVVLLTDPRYEGRAAVECHGVEVVICRQLVDEAIARAAAHGVDRLHFESEHVSHHVGTEVVAAGARDHLEDCVPTVGLVERERTTKAPAELARLARACAITEAVLDDVLAGGLVGRTEREVARLVEDGLRAREAAVGFPTIVAAGTHGAVPHHEPTTRLIDDGDLVTIDCGARIDGYHADTTRTVAAGSPPVALASVDLCDAFEMVAAAQQRGVEAVGVGVTTRDIDRAARDLLVEAGYGDRFVHGTGHGVGLEIHEAPAVSSSSSDSLAASTPLTVEPGVYVPGCGGVRVEDTVVTTTEGPAIRLTTSPRTLLVV